MTEFQLIDDVRSALDDATAGLRAPDDAAARARTRGRRRLVTRGLLAGVPAAGLIAGLTITANSGTAVTGATASHRPHAGAGPSAETAAYIERHIVAALNTASSYIIKTTASSGPGQATTSYEDPVTGTTRSVVSGTGDRVTYWIKTRVAADADYWHTTYVDYTTHTWWTKDSHSGRLGKVASDSPVVLSSETGPGQIRQAIEEGELGVAGRGRVNGHAAIELRYAGKLAGRAGAVNYWVDARTYQPVQMDFPPFTAASTVTESWIPKSAAIVTQTNTPQIPAGFRRVVPPATFN